MRRRRLIRRRLTRRRLVGRSIVRGMSLTKLAQYELTGYLEARGYRGVERRNQLEQGVRLDREANEVLVVGLDETCVSQLEQPGLLRKKRRWSTSIEAKAGGDSISQGEMDFEREKPRLSGYAASDRVATKRVSN